MEGNVNSGFSIESLILLESSFKRIDTVSFDDDVRNNLNINTEVGVQGNVINVIETVTIEQLHGETRQVEVAVKMAGVFRKEGETEISDLESFGHINGAAIIFPYIREHITGLSLKAGINPLIIPPVNFTKRELIQKP